MSVGARSWQSSWLPPTLQWGLSRHPEFILANCTNCKNIFFPWSVLRNCWCLSADIYQNYSSWYINFHPRISMQFHKKHCRPYSPVGQAGIKHEQSQTMQTKDPSSPTLMSPDVGKLLEKKGKCLCWLPWMHMQPPTILILQIFLSLSLWNPCPGSDTWIFPCVLHVPWQDLIWDLACLSQNCSTLQSDFPHALSCSFCFLLICSQFKPNFPTVVM